MVVNKGIIFKCTHEVHNEIINMPQNNGQWLLWTTHVFDSTDRTHCVEIYNATLHDMTYLMLKYANYYLRLVK